MSFSNVNSLYMFFLAFCCRLSTSRWFAILWLLQSKVLKTISEKISSFFLVELASIVSSLVALLWKGGWGAVGYVSYP